MVEQSYGDRQKNREWYLDQWGKRMKSDIIIFMATVEEKW